MKIRKKNIHSDVLFINKAEQTTIFHWLIALLHQQVKGRTFVAVLNKKTGIAVIT